MEYYKNLYPYQEKKKIQLVLGAVFIALSIFWVLNKMDNKVPVFDWIYSIVLFLNGIVLIMQYFGYRMEELFGERFIRVTTEKIQYKPKTLKSDTTILWSNITSILFKVNHVQIEYSNGQIINLKYQSMDYSSVQKLKNTITEIAKNKNLTIN